MRPSPLAGRRRASRASTRLAFGAAILTAATACSSPPPSTAPPSPVTQPGAPSAVTVRPGVAPPGSAPSSPAQDAAERTFTQLEHTFGARLGVYAVDTGTGTVITHRPDDRFGYASTHKVFVAAALLRRLTVADLDRAVPITPADLVEGAPITHAHVGGSMTLRELMDAALRYSDNTADDLLFRQIGGPAGLAGALRGIGDTATHVDRVEPDLNLTAPGDIRDTTTPRAWAADLRAVVLGSLLPADRRTVITDMMRANTTGNTLIRAGVPAGWSVADKTGNADYGTRNDIAVVWPPSRPPVVLVILSNRPRQHDPSNDALIARAAAATITALQPH